MLCHGDFETWNQGMGAKNWGGRKVQGESNRNRMWGGVGLDRKSEKNRKRRQMKAKVVMLPLSVNFEKTSTSSEKTARQAWACSHTGSSGEGAAYSISLVKRQQLTKSASWLEPVRGGKALQLRAETGFLALPMTQHKQRSPKMAKAEHRARFQGKSLRQLPEGLGIAM